MNLFSTLETHFTNLDNCPLIESKIFESEQQKERYESYIMFAFRKFRSLSYHLSNVNDLWRKEADSLLEEIVDLPEMEGASSVRSTMKVNKDSFDFTYELSAFLGALKSCLDLLSETTSFYMKGISVNFSISTLLKQVDKKKGNILAFVELHSNWIRTVRDYRHPLLHRLVLNARSGYEIHRFNDKTSRVLYPVLIPETTPAFVPDTRQTRMMNDDLPNLSYSEQTITRINDGIEEVSDFQINVEPSQGYVRIEDFMKKHEAKCEKFFIELIETLDKLDFSFDTCT